MTDKQIDKVNHLQHLIFDFGSKLEDFNNTEHMEIMSYGLIAAFANYFLDGAPVEANQAAVHAVKKLMNDIYDEVTKEE